MSIESEKEEKCRMIFCARPTFIIDLGVVHQSFDHVVSLFKKEKEKKTTLYVACCYRLLPCAGYLRDDHRPKSFSPFTLITVSNLGKRVHTTQCELLLLRGFCFCFLFWLFSSTPDHVVTSPRGRFIFLIGYGFSVWFVFLHLKSRANGEIWPVGILSYFFFILRSLWYLPKCHQDAGAV